MKGHSWNIRFLFHKEHYELIKLFGIIEGIQKLTRA